MATPHIAGLAALLWQAKLNQIENAIFAAAQLARGARAERGNRGVPNGKQALAALLG